MPGEFHGQRSLADYSPWGCTKSDMTEAAKQQLHSCRHCAVGALLSVHSKSHHVFPPLTLVSGFPSHLKPKPTSSPRPLRACRILAHPPPTALASGCSSNTPSAFSWTSCRHGSIRCSRGHGSFPTPSSSSPGCHLSEGLPGPCFQSHSVSVSIPCPASLFCTAPDVTSQEHLLVYLLSDFLPRL